MCPKDLRRSHQRSEQFAHALRGVAGKRMEVFSSFSFGLAAVGWRHLRLKVFKIL